MMRYGLSLIYALFEANWRRWKGKESTSWYNAKWIKVLLNVVITFGILFLFGYHWLQAIVGTILFQFVFWNPAVGGALDMGRDYPPSEETIKRYKSKFWNKWCEFLVPKKAWYGYFYDFLWMMFRYGLPACLVSFVLLNPFFLLAGVTSALSYTLAWALYDKDGTNPDMAEYFSGFFAGLLLTL